MALFEIVREVALPPEESWRRLTDWEQHGQHVPLTRIIRTDRGFTARTGVGRLGFDDPMEIVEWSPPRFCRLEKRGRVVTGWAEVGVEPTVGGSRVTWREDLHVRGVPRWGDGLTRAAGTRMFSRVIDRLLA
ncbi:SRPBCC family protein [Aeromicrobium sp. NPDC092404]|uniref:SRPBCC family protein n=1 Tax=Aeromicrobium sp. NPDC092404 TaxID=3154976 RepID=UPI0034273869